MSAWQASWQLCPLCRLRLWQKAFLSKEAADRMPPAHQMDLGWLWLPPGPGMFTVLGDFSCEAPSLLGVGGTGGGVGEQGLKWDNRAHAGASLSD